MAKKPCKCKETECEECPEWIFTFADLVMLMMGFFVILWVLKPAPGKDGEQPQALPVELLAAIREAFGHVPDPTSKDPVDVHMLLKKLEQLKPLKGPGDGGPTKRPKQGVEGDQPEVESIRKGPLAVIGGRVLFAVGDSTLTPEAVKVLDQIAALIKGKRNVIMVKGHAGSDDFAEETTAELKMDLSLRRAKVVADYLVGHGASPDTLRVVGCSVFEPVAQRAYIPETRALNRRVEVEDIRTLVNEFQNRPTPVQPTGQEAAGAAQATHDATSSVH